MSTKVATVPLTSQTLSAGAGVNGTTVTATSGYGISISGQITNGGTAPTVACTMTIQKSGDGTNWYFYSQQSAGLAVSTTYSFCFDLPPSIMYARPVFGGNTVQPVTVAAQAEQVTAL